MIVVDGFCLSKNDVYHLKDYFDKLSNKGEYMNIKCILLKNRIF